MAHHHRENLVAFMEAADLSKARGGAPVALAAVTQRK
jgi:hypothetical protein